MDVVLFLDNLLNLVQSVLTPVPFNILRPSGNEDQRSTTLGGALSPGCARVPGHASQYTLGPQHKQGVSQRARSVAEGTADLPSGYHKFQSFPQILFGLPQLVPGMLSECTPGFGTSDIGELEEGRDEFLGVFGLCTGARLAPRNRGAVSVEFKTGVGI